MICLNMVGYSTAVLLTSRAAQYLQGKLRDRIMKVNSFFFMILTVLYVFYSHLLSRFVYIAMVAIVLGVIDTIFQQMISVYLSETFPRQTEPYALFKLIQNFICAIFMLIYIYSTYENYKIINAIMHVFFSTCFVFVFNNNYTAASRHSKHAEEEINRMSVEEQY